MRVDPRAAFASPTDSLERHKPEQAGLTVAPDDRRSRGRSRVSYSFLPSLMAI